MSLYWQTLQIVSGILSPIAVLYLLHMLRESLRWHAEIAEARHENQRRRNPYDKIVVHQAPNPSMFSVQFWRDSVLVHEQGAEKGSNIK